MLILNVQARVKKHRKVNLLKKLLKYINCVTFSLCDQECKTNLVEKEEKDVNFVLKYNQIIKR